MLHLYVVMRYNIDIARGIRMKKEHYDPASEAEDFQKEFNKETREVLKLFKEFKDEVEWAIQEGHHLNFDNKHEFLFRCMESYTEFCEIKRHTKNNKD